MRCLGPANVSHLTNRRRASERSAACLTFDPSETWLPYGYRAEVSLALVHGGLAWVDRAKARARPADRFDAMAEEAWQPSPAEPQESRTLMTSIDEMD